MRSKKIRGLKRRQKQFVAWKEFHENIDLSRLKNFEYVYAKAKFGPWANLFNEKPYPAGYRNQLLSSLFDFYYNWKRILDNEYEKYYLKIWLNFPRFIDSQIVAAIGNKISYYENLFERCNEVRVFPKEAFNQNLQRIDQFQWKLHYDRDYYLESSYTELDIADFYSPKDFYHEKRFYNRLLKDNFPYRLIERNGSTEKLFYKNKGFMWIGEEKKNGC